MNIVYSYTGIFFAYYTPIVCDLVQSGPIEVYSTYSCVGALYDCTCTEVRVRDLQRDRIHEDDAMRRKTVKSESTRRNSQKQRTK